MSRSGLLKAFLRPKEDLATEGRRDVVEHLFALSRHRVDVLDAGVVTLSGEVRDSSLVPLSARLTRTVEGVVDVQCKLTAKGST
ncbi:BON domain-containing protein [Streptomyces tanashiensis]|uniref:BON domain-containing protein n=1 Tax=Streptomyces tanashiensis TaxID=67367 RepID=UPI0019BA6A85|nr:BON domain-containing protein [Streptomyces tanashiensis]GGY56110.1 hypothetical protein GCM10010299_73370 [Streptomyces tanashiensis]